MKATRIYTLLALLLMAGGVTMQAQEYESYFGADSTRLNVLQYCIDWVTTGYMEINTADTVNINGHDYLHATPRGIFFENAELYFREETATGRLYRYFPMIDEEEVLLCDMSLTVGDTFYQISNWGMAHPSVVESVSFENGRKVIRFALPVYPWHDALTFREGIFPNNFPIGYLDYYDFENNLLCEYKDGEQVFENPEYNTCYIDETSVQEQGQQQVSLCPNPAKGKVIIEGIQPAEVEVYNAFGQVVKKVRGTNEINVADLQQGVYLLRITDEEGRNFIAKVAVRR
ncbi:MAG: T9SS type A sorting domain-containing protein [Bacteroidales bacterium]|nr:T9SS type A sorting domain-containing protein [Bacteroidales bacterium]